jgi:FkbM family methyltransferase
MNRLESFFRITKRGFRLSSRSAFIGSVRPGYEFLLDLLYGSKGLERSIQGEEPVRLLPSYRCISEDAEPRVFAALKCRTLPGGVVLDIGANVGLFSLVMARWVGKTGRIFAFEPAPESLQALRRHIQLNELADRIEPVGCAVSDTTGEARFYAHTFNGENTLSASFARRVPAARAVLVPITTIDAFCAAHGVAPTLLKIDIEGFEIHALRGAKETLARYRPSVIVEMHPMIWPEIGVDADQVDRTFTDLGYRRVALDGQNNELAEYGHIVLEPIW